MSLVELEKSLTETLDQCWHWDCIGQSQRALDDATASLEQARAVGDQAVIAQACQQIAWSLGHLGRANDGLDSIQESRRLWIELGNEREQARAAAIYAFLLMELGDSEEALLVVSEAARLAQRLGDKAVLAFTAGFHAVALNQCGDLDTALTVQENALRLADEVGAPYDLAAQLVNRGYFQCCLAERCVELGDAEGAAAAYSAAINATDWGVAVAQTHSILWYQRIGLANGAEFYALKGDFEGANARLQAWLEVPGMPADRLARQHAYSRCEVLILEGRLEEAGVLWKATLEQARTKGMLFFELNMMRKLCDLDEARGDFKAAFEHHKQYHAAYKTFAGEAIQRRVRLAALNQEVDDLKLRVEEADMRAERMAAEAEIDPLTGIANRRKFDRELQRLQASGASYALAIVDLDHFKAINDRFSHLVGDDVLRVVADTLTMACRQKDLVARIGGEELALLLPDVNFELAEKIRQRFRTKLALVAWSSVAPGLKVTASVGLALSSETSGTRALFSLADERLYAAKAAGRDCLVGMTGAPHAYSH